MSRELRVGIDIGATKTMVGLVNAGGETLSEQRLPTGLDGCRPHVASALGVATALLQTHDVAWRDIEAIGIGVPGTADATRGVAEYCPNLNWENEPIAAMVSEVTGLRPTVVQDSRAAAWAEWMFTPAVSPNLLAVTVGTGIGAGLIINGQLVTGARNTAGELGHSVLERDGRPCPCGQRGCLERYVSGPAILERALTRLPDELSRTPSAGEVFQLAAQGSSEARDLLTECVDELALMLVNAINLTGVDCVVISGGLCTYEELFVSPLREHVNARGYEGWLRRGPIDLFASPLGPSAPMLGAAFIDLAALDRTRSPLTRRGGDHEAPTPVLRPHRPAG